MVRIGLDLLAQLIDMGLWRMRLSVGVVAPDVAEEHVTAHDSFVCAVEVFEQIGLSCRELHLLAPGGINQQLRAWAESVWTDGQHRVLALFMLAELCSQSREQHIEAERLDYVVARARFITQGAVGDRGGA